MPHAAHGLDRARQASSVHRWPLAMSSNAATSFAADVDSFPQDVDDAFRARILTALRDVRARE